MGMEEYKPSLMMILCQFLYSGVILIGRAALLQGMSSMIFVVYRQSVAFVLIAPIAYFTRRETLLRLGWKNFWLIFLLSFIGITCFQNAYYGGLYLASSSAASALYNLIPAITFILAYIMSYPDHLSLTTWMCLIGAIQSGILTLIFEPSIKVWKLNSSLQLICCLYSGLASGTALFAQAWCISKRGPVFASMFNPLSTVIVTVLACVFMHEQLYIGSLAGALAVILGLYVVLWGKANDNLEAKNETTQRGQNDLATSHAKISDSTSLENDMENPLLSEMSTNFGGQTSNS